MHDSSNPCHILQAFISTAQHQLRIATDMEHPMAARHTVNTVAKFTAVMLRLSRQRPEALAPVASELDDLVTEGKATSAAVPYQCRECGDLYHRRSPDASTELCEFCQAESKEQSSA